MPELPEVETTRRGLETHLVGATIVDAVIRNRSLRWPIPDLPIQGRTILSLTRRAKYLLADCGNGTLILHLGMSGSLRILPSDTPPAVSARGMSGVSPQLHCDPPAVPARGMSGVSPQLRCDPPAVPARGMSGVSPQLRCDPPATHDHFDL